MTTQIILSSENSVRRHRKAIRQIVRESVTPHMEATEAYDAAMEALDAAGYEPDVSAIDPLDAVIARSLAGVLL